MGRHLLRYRAGPRALRRLRREGLAPGAIRAVVGPASGPRWLVLAGLDRALLDGDLLTRGRILLAGASAGAWRMMAFACDGPRRAHRRLLDGYGGKVFARDDTPVSVSRAYRDLLAEVLDGGEDGVLTHPVFDLAIHTARPRLGASRAALAATFLTAVPLNLLTARATDLFFERVLFHSCPPRFHRPYAGSVVPLERRNLLPAALATGTVPFYLESVRDISGAPAGGYVDGGLTDYHLNQAYAEEDAGLVLLPHYRRRVLPRWLDRMRPSRTPAPEALADLLLIYPSKHFVAGLPDGYVPDRHDFKRFADDPEARIRRWRATVAAGEALGEQLADDLEAGRIPDLVQPL